MVDFPGTYAAGTQPGNYNPKFQTVSVDTLTVVTSIAGSGGVLGAGSFTSATGVTTVTNAASSGSSAINVMPRNSAAGLTQRLNTCYVTTGSGSFTFTISATAAGGFTGNEVWSYEILA